MGVTVPLPILVWCLWVWVWVDKKTPKGHPCHALVTVTTHFGIVHESSICSVDFYDTLYFILQIIPYMFYPPSIRLLSHVQMFLEILMYDYDYS